MATALSLEFSTRRCERQRQDILFGTVSLLVHALSGTLLRAKNLTATSPANPADDYDSFDSISACKVRGLHKMMKLDVHGQA
jgi:hypothetical protein